MHTRAETYKNDRNEGNDKITSGCPYTGNRIWRALTIVLSGGSFDKESSPFDI